MFLCYHLHVVLRSSLANKAKVSANLKIIARKYNRKRGWQDSMSHEILKFV